MRRSSGRSNVSVYKSAHLLRVLCFSNKIFVLITLKTKITCDGNAVKSYIFMVPFCLYLAFLGFSPW